MQIRIDTRYAAFCLFLLLPACDKPLSHDQDCASSIKDNSPGEIDQIIYLPGLKDQYRPASIRSFDKTHVLVTGPEDLILNKYGLIEWTPSLSISAGTHDVTLQNQGSGDGDTKTELLKLTVLPSRAVNGESEGRFFKVTDKSSGLFGYLFEFSNNVSAEIIFREVSRSCLPEQDYFHKIVSAGFYSLSDIEFNLYVPENDILFKVLNPYSVLRTESHYWANYSVATSGFERRSSWNDFYGWSEQVKFEGTRYLKYERMSANGLIVIGLSQHDHKSP